MGSLAVIVATHNRAAQLDRLLTSALRMREPPGVRLELLVADNASTDRTRDVVAAAAARHPGVRHVYTPVAGKSRALNHAIRATAAALLAFVDDDVTFDPAWLTAAYAYFADGGAAAAQGTIRLPPALAGDPAIAAAVARWGTIPCRERPVATAPRTLTGANMFVTRAAFAHVGLFDERLGPGAAGASEDTELALRIGRAGLAIGWVRDAVVYHDVEPERLTPGYFRRMHELRGRSRVYYKGSGAASRVLPNLGLAALSLASATLIGHTRARTKALGRWHHYRGMLRGYRAPRLAGGVPRLEGPER